MVKPIFCLQIALQMCDDIAAINILVVVCKLLPSLRQQMKKAEKLILNISVQNKGFTTGCPADSQTKKSWLSAPKIRYPKYFVNT